MAILCLPDEITDLIAKRLDVYEDFIRFSAVCKSWQSSVKRTKRCFSPWLMLVASIKDDKQKFYSLSSNCVFNLDFFHTKKRKCWGSPFGWLVSYGIDMNLLLVNPFSRLTLPLPPQSTFQYQYEDTESWHVTPKHNLRAFVSKCILSASPTTSHSCVVLAICGEIRNLAFARPGDEAWISIESSLAGYADAIFYQGQFYAVRGNGTVSVIDISCPNPIAIDFASPPEDVDYDKIVAITLETQFYLVEISGNLYFVAQVWYLKSGRPPRIGTLRFRVHKLDLETRQWIRVKDLGNHAVFLGAQTSFSISASDFPHCRPNCIYFNDHYDLYETPVCDMGVYDLRNKTVEDVSLHTNRISEIFRPIYIMPSF